MAFTTFTWAQIRQRLNDRLEQKAFWTPDEQRDAFNEAMSAWNLFTGYWKKRITIATVANIHTYVLPGSMVYQTRVTFNGLPLSPSSRHDFNNARYTWRGESTTTGGDVPNRPMMWAPLDLFLFQIWPSDAAGGNSLIVDGVATTPVIANDDNTIDVAEGILTTLLGYAQHALLFKKGGPDFQASMALFKAFLDEAVEQNSQLKATNAYRRVMGLEWRDQKPLSGKTTLLDTLVGKVS